MIHYSRQFCKKCIRPSHLHTGSRPAVVGNAQVREGAQTGRYERWHDTEASTSTIAGTGLSLLDFLGLRHTLHKSSRSKSSTSFLQGCGALPRGIRRAKVHPTHCRSAVARRPYAIRATAYHIRSVLGDSCARQGRTQTCTGCWTCNNLNSLDIKIGRKCFPDHRLALLFLNKNKAMARDASASPPAVGASTR